MGGPGLPPNVRPFAVKRRRPLGAKESVGAFVLVSHAVFLFNVALLTMPNSATDLSCGGHNSSAAPWGQVFTQGFGLRRQTIFSW